MQPGIEERFCFVPSLRGLLGGGGGTSDDPISSLVLCFIEDKGGLLFGWGV